MSAGPPAAPARTPLRRLWPYLQPHRRVLAVVAVVSLLGAAAALAQPLLVSSVISAVQDGRPTRGAVTVLVALLVGGALSGAVQTYLLQRTAEGVVLGTRRALVARLLHLPVEEIDRRRVGDLMSRVGADTTLLRSVVTSGVVDLVSSALVVVGAVIAMALVDPVLLAAALGCVSEVADLRPEDEGPAVAPAPVAGSPPALELRGVDYDYPDGTQVLRDVSFTVARGTRCALVGPSGAGKSTVLALVERFYDVDAGAVLVDGHDVRALPRSALRAGLGYVEQEAPVLAGTLRDNLVLAAPEATDAQLTAVLAAVNMTSVAERSPLGLDAPVGDGGVLLSGGERQRLALARSLLARPRLLLLDEPTSSLDARNERALRDAVDAVAVDRTVLVVAHRLSTVVDSDQIVVLDAGRVVASGTHGELLQDSPLYRDLASTQLLA